MKYKSEEGTSYIEIFSKSMKDSVSLYITDNGIGISEGEILRVFEKSFTGMNGRISSKKSTGIGLYLCKKLCDKLGILIEIKSSKGKGTEVKIVFPRSSYINLT